MTADDPVRWVRRATEGVTILLGWVFILWANRFHVTAPVVFVCLGFLAVVATVLNLWRTGASVAAPEPADEDWVRPIGVHGELEKEKRSLLKAIKEAEFDLEMGKLSQADANEMIRLYRARAIEVIKELDRLDAGQAGTVRERIEREVQARLEVERAAKKKGAGGAKGEAKAEKPAQKSDAKAEKKPDAKAEKKSDAKAEKKPDAKAEKKPDAKAAEPAEKQPDTQTEEPDAQAEEAEADAPEAAAAEVERARQEASS